MFLGRYNLITIEEKISVFNDDVEIYSADSNKECYDDSDDSDKESPDRKIQMKKISYINLRKKQEKIDKFVWKNILGTFKFPLKYNNLFLEKIKSFFIMGQESSISQDIGNIVRAAFLFLELGKLPHEI